MNVVVYSQVHLKIYGEIGEHTQLIYQNFSISIYLNIHGIPLIIIFWFGDNGISIVEYTLSNIFFKILLQC